MKKEMEKESSRWNQCRVRSQLRILLHVCILQQAFTFRICGYVQQHRHICVVCAIIMLVKIKEDQKTTKNTEHSRLFCTFNVALLTPKLYTVVTSKKHINQRIKCTVCVYFYLLSGVPQLTAQFSCRSAHCSNFMYEFAFAMSNEHPTQ